MHSAQAPETMSASLLELGKYIKHGNPTKVSGISTCMEGVFDDNKRPDAFITLLLQSILYICNVGFRSTPAL